MYSTTTYKVAFIDVGGTLLHPEESIGTTYARFLARYDITAQPGIIDEKFMSTFRTLKLKARAKNSTAYGATPQTAKTFWRNVFGQCIPGSLSTTVMDDVFEEVYSHYGKAEAWALFPDTIPFLEGLRENNVPAFIVSNWDARLPELLENMGIMPFVDGCYGSYFMDSEKPDTRIFEHALDRLPAGFNSSHVLHVGDNPDEDGLGAERCGIAFAHINRPGPITADNQASSLLDFLIHFSGK